MPSAVLRTEAIWPPRASTYRPRWLAGQANSPAGRWWIGGGVLCVLFAACVSTGELSSRAWGQDPSQLHPLTPPRLPVAGNELRARLEHVSEFLRNQQWQEAVQTLRQLMEDQGDLLIEAPADSAGTPQGFATYIPLAEYCQLELASWSRRAPEALAIYRRQVDPLARRWYTEARTSQDEALLQRIVDRFLLSSEGDAALWRLGTLALERGNHILARLCWERISPCLRTSRESAALLGCTPGTSWWAALQGCDLDAVWPELRSAIEKSGETTDWLAYPDTELPLADVRARLVMVSILEGSPARAERELDLLRRLHPDATGWLAGREGVLHELVAAELQSSRSWAPRPTPRGWTTLAGAPSRNHRPDQEIDPHRRPAWRVSLPRLSAGADQVGQGRTRVAESADGPLSYHVAADQGRVFIHQPDLLRALDIRTGQPLWSSRAMGNRNDALESGAFFRLSSPAVTTLVGETHQTGVPRYGVTVEGHYLLARMGDPWTGGPGRDHHTAPRSCLVGIDLRTQKLLFDRLVPDEPGWEFEAAPVLHRDRILVSLRRHDSVNAQAAVACYSLDTGRQIWKTLVVQAQPIGGNAYELPNGALAFHDDRLFFNTRLGVVAALRADDGRLLWACSYPRSGFADPDSTRNDRHLFRDLGPSLVDRDLVISAPADCDRILAVDAATGHLTWTTAAERAVDAIHLLGVTDERLVVSGDYLYWFDVGTGKLVGQFPSPGSPHDRHARPAPHASGRGLLTRDHVYWPTSGGIRVFSAREPREVRQPIELATWGVPAGNLLVHDGMLLIVSADELVAFESIGRPSGTNGATLQHP